MQNNLKYVSNKLLKTRIVLNDRKLAKHVPHTRPFQRIHLFAMLERYNMVYVKPNTGSLGIGVMRVEKGANLYRYQSGVRAFTFPTFQAMCRSLQKKIGKKKYLIQKGIHVLKYDGRPYDFRVMIQKNPAGTWECTGTVARVAHPRKAVTNGSQGGTIFLAPNLIEPTAGTEKTARLLSQMERLARLTAVQFSRAYPAMNELGLDIAVDRQLNPWILEVNTRPDPCPFTKLADKKIINKIVGYAKSYGRRYCLTCSKAKRSPDHT
ncbi:YheC/YheD family protein [Paenibacillus sp. SYP-B3998]|uniref:YheC/YheD family protein n=1 Tax=Paenibacillus sp. SYP-B3998 TaxID=2678564 RepID=A0A6G4A0A8_9BACL|nr:YheC/YheD family protein [Paenibacillus sp. SYP-B3998]NEW07916.1 YheC/YheD family protein [Paenibacillus sp. SYP-B3998]